MRINYLILIVLISSNCFANDILSMSLDEFYKIEENNEMYEQMLESGQIDKSREEIKTFCVKKAENEKELEQCKCIASEIDKVDGKVFLYESLFSYNSYQAKFEAKMNSDEAEYQRLKKNDEERDSLSKMIERVCGKS